MGLRSLQRDRGRPYKCDSPGMVKSAITVSTLFCICEWHSLDIYVTHFDFCGLIKNIKYAIYGSKFMIH